MDVDGVEGLDGCTPVDLAQLVHTPAWVHPYNLAAENLRVDADWVIADPLLGASAALAGGRLEWLNLQVVVKHPSSGVRGCAPTAYLVLHSAGAGAIDTGMTGLTDPRVSLDRLAGRSQAARLLTGSVDLTDSVAAAHAAALAEWIALVELQPLERAERFLAAVCPRGRSRDVDELLWTPMAAARAAVDSGHGPMVSNHVLCRILANLANRATATLSPLPPEARRVLRTAAAPPMHHLTAYTVPNAWCGRSVCKVDKV